MTYLYFKNLYIFKQKPSTHILLFYNFIFSPFFKLQTQPYLINFYAYSPLPSLYAITVF